MSEPTSGRWSPRLVGGAVLALVVAAAGFLVLDVVVAAALAVLLVTGLVIVVLARDWDEHSSFEERELERARRRKAKWEQGADARERDRRRWEAHQARQAGKGPDA
jgi:hypothetical protein